MRRGEKARLGGRHRRRHVCRGDVGCGRGLGSRGCLGGGGGLFSYSLVDDFGGTYLQFPSLTRRLQRHRHKSREGCTRAATMTRARRALSGPAEALHGARRDEQHANRASQEPTARIASTQHARRAHSTVLAMRARNGTAGDVARVSGWGTTLAVHKWTGRTRHTGKFCKGLTMKRGRSAHHRR